MTRKNIVRRLEKFATPTIYEAAGKLGDMEPTIRPIVPGARMVGPAFTVKCFIGDLKAVLRAIDLAHPGDVLVIDAGGSARATAWGGTSALAAKMRGLSGCVTNGAVRDLDELVEIGFPVFAAGVSVRGTVKLHPGWNSIMVCVGGVSVRPGDIVVGDADGVVVVPIEQAEDICAQAAMQRKKEREIERRLRAGESVTKIFGITD
jgi:4-hydroxy-4-methyl-2-oxoglutarate aldolase